MTELDQAIRQIVTTLAVSAPDPPPLGDRDDAAPVHRGPGNPRSGNTIGLSRLAPPRRARLLIGVAAGVGLLVAGAGLANRLLTDDRVDIATVGPVPVAYHRIDYVRHADLSCTGSQGAGTTTLVIETWTDAAGGRVYQRATYPDGSTREGIFLGPMDRPLQVYEKGASALVRPACWDTHQLRGDPTDDAAPVLLDATMSAVGPLDPTSNETVVPDLTTDNEGRPVRVVRSSIDGFLIADDGSGDELPIRQTRDRYLDLQSGALRQLVWTDESPGQYRIEETMTEVANETRPVDPAIFDTSGFKLTVDLAAELGGFVTAEPVEPTITIGTNPLWLPANKAETAQDAGIVFARDVLGWQAMSARSDQPDLDRPGPTFITVTDAAADRELRLLVVPDGDRGWAIQQVTDGVVSGMGLAPSGGVIVHLDSTANGERALVHLRTTSGELLAWRVALRPLSPAILLPSVRPEDVASLLVLVQDADGFTIAAG